MLESHVDVSSYSQIVALTRAWDDLQTAFFLDDDGLRLKSGSSRSQVSAIRLYSRLLQCFVVRLALKADSS